MSLRPAASLPLRQLLRHAPRRLQERRCLHSLPSRPKPSPTHHQHLFQGRRAGTLAGNAKTLFRQNPVSVSLAAVCLLSGVLILAYANYIYQTHILAAFHNYPEEVAKKLRKAIYYSKTDIQPQEAIKFYRQALQVAEEIGMDPFSDEILGVKIEVAGLMERVRANGKAVQVLEILRGDCLEWIRRFGGLEKNRVKRTRVLGKIVQISVKLGELYGSPEVYDREMAEERLVWAVETVLKEQQRRQNLQSTEHLTDEQLDELEGRWMSPSEIGASLEALAHKYEEKEQYYLAAPLFLQALSLYPTKDCHTVILMNNLASSLAQQSPRAAAAAQSYASSYTLTNSTTNPVTTPTSFAKPTPPSPTTAPAVTRESLIQNGITWANKALEVAASISPPERTEECDMGCAVATHNLGEFAEMLGLKGEAAKRYREAVSIAKAVGFQEGVVMSNERLRELEKGR